jgi:hypothetical protein
MNKMIKQSVLAICAVGLMGLGLQAKDNLGAGKRNTAGRALRTSAACAPSSSSAELDVNNVRCLLHNGGDMWWDLVGQPRYEVPKVDNPADKRYSSFAASLWIGGVDESGQMRVAAQTYRQTGYDFWPGPLTDVGASIEATYCEKWDKHFKIEKAEIDACRAAYQASISSGSPFVLDDYPNVKNWPAFGETSDGNRVALAPFVSVSGDPFNYNPNGGDYPDISPVPGGGTPDQAIWWVINDKGDVHTETGGEAIGLEIQMLAFAFSTANAINDMTFYKYKVINKSTYLLNDTYMGQWVDSDVGNYADDYVGCDTTRGLGFAYNGDANDETASGYGTNPPCFGMDFFQGPVGDDGDRLKMSYFVYYENDFSLRGNPEVATHFYGYLRGYWKDGSRMVDNGKNGYPGTAPGTITQFMYPGDGGWCGGAPSGWTEVSAGNTPFDRRFIESAGPFTLQPGAVNEIITGAVWARGYYNSQLGSVCEILKADDIAQALFDANFQLLDGPDAPTLTVSEYDQELLLSWGYSDLLRDIVNNYNESYLQADPVLVSQNVADSTFKFQGYMVFQLKDATVSISEVFDSEKARLVAQCDIEDLVTTLVNRTTSSVPGLSEPVIVDQVMVQGANEGTFYSTHVTEDLFATGSDRRLKNYTTYYYGIIAYAENDTTSDGRRFVQGNRFFSNTPAMPHKITFENFGTSVGASYGDGIAITQIEGTGNGGNFLDITPECEATILSSASAVDPSVDYMPGAAPITVKVVDPKLIKAADYRIELKQRAYDITVPVDTIAWDTALGTGILDSTFIEWILFEDGAEIYRSTYVQRTGEGPTFFRPQPLSGMERVIPDRGFSVAVRETQDAGDSLTLDPVIGSSITYADPIKAWMLGIPDDDEFAVWNWIASGIDPSDRSARSFNVYDNDGDFEEMVGGTWAPFCLARGFANRDIDGKISPGVDIRQATDNVSWIAATDARNTLSMLPDVDIVFTADVTKWSKCMVIETTPSQNLGSGAWPMSARWEYPITVAGSTDLNTGVDINTEQGMSYFPGYAINVNTGERLNIFFGESSFDKLNNGDDMVWNPTADFGTNGDRVGGRHFVYVHNTRYDGCQSLVDILRIGTQIPTGTFNSRIWFNEPDTTNKFHRVYKNTVWCGVPMLNGNFEFSDPKQIPTDVRVKLRVKRPFGSRVGTTDYPVFTFNTRDIAASTGQTDLAQGFLDKIRVVPNPYYAYSRYEASQLQTLVKLTNLPQKCKIRIYTLNGTLIRTFNKDSDEPEQVWDLKNQSGVPIASGPYIIHIDAFDLGETVVKFFAVMPQLDLQSF